VRLVPCWSGAEVPLFIELEPVPELLVVPEALFVLVEFAELFIPLVVLSFKLLDDELLLVDPLFEFPEEEPDMPVVAEPEVLALPEVDAPVLTEPDTPVVAEPEVPVVAEPEMPVEPFTPVEPFIPVDPLTPAVPFTPVEPFIPVDPFTPVEPLTPVEPFIPVVPFIPVEPFTLVEPFTPVPAEPETLPDVEAVPLFRDEPVDTVPFIDPDVEAFMPEAELPLFH